MPPDMAISMRHTKITAKDAAILAGEVEKPGWQSKNEGIHERVSFEDSIWGFDLAGGAYYKTPLRVVGVKPDSRAEKAGIRPGDRLKRINDIETSTLTIQEAHTIIIESGVHLKLAVTAPEDEEDAYYCYEDPVDSYDSEEERRRLEEEKIRKRQVHAKVSSYWSLQWPWVSKRRIIYRESNCFMVPSKFEGKNRSKFPIQPIIRQQDDIVLNGVKPESENSKVKSKYEPLPENSLVNGQSPMTNGIDHENILTNGVESSIKENGVKTLPEIPERLEENIEEEVSELEDINGLADHSEKEEASMQEEEEVSQLDSQTDSEREEKSETELSQATESTDSHDKLIDEVLENHDISKEEEDNILDRILSENDANSSNER